jgi:hypothetical protein
MIMKVFPYTSVLFNFFLQGFIISTVEVFHFTSLFKFIFRVFLQATVNGIVFLISLSVCSLLVYRIAINFCKLFLYPATWLKMFIRCRSYLVELLSKGLYQSANKDNLTSSCSIWISLIFLLILFFWLVIPVLYWILN